MKHIIYVDMYKHNPHSNVSLTTGLYFLKGATVMRIERYQQISQLYNVQQSVNTSKTKESKFAMGRDSVSISKTAYDYQVAKNAVANASDVREDKIAKLKESVQSGNYSVDPASFANKLLEKYNNMVF